MEKTYTITLVNGTELSGLRLNGNNFISEEEIDETIFENNLSSVVISDGETEEYHPQMVLAHITEQFDGQYWFTLRDLSQQELVDIKNRSDIDYIAMMTGVNLSQSTLPSYSANDDSFSQINKYYNTKFKEQRIWEEQRVRNAVVKGIITQQQYTQITGQSYT